MAWKQTVCHCLTRPVERWSGPEQLVARCLAMLDREWHRISLGDALDCHWSPISHLISNHKMRERIPKHGFSSFKTIGHSSDDNSITSMAPSLTQRSHNTYTDVRHRAQRKRESCLTVRVRLNSEAQLWAQSVRQTVLALQESLTLHS